MEMGPGLPARRSVILMQGSRFFQCLGCAPKAHKNDAVALMQCIRSGARFDFQAGAALRCENAALRLKAVRRFVVLSFLFLQTGANAFHGRRASISAARSSSKSSRPKPETSCTPIGIPFASGTEGRLSAGTPAAFANPVNTRSPG